MLYALCSMRLYVWKDFFVQRAIVFILFSRPDGNAIAGLFSISNLNPNFPSKKL